MIKLGIDLGGTKIEGAVLDSKNKQLIRRRIPTEQEGGYEHIVDNLIKLYHHLLQQINGAEHTVGIGTPGALSSRTGLLKNSNTLCLNERPLKADLEQRLQRPIAMQNDANCFTMAEAIEGAGRGQALVFGVIMGTGCGGGIVHNGQLITGLQAIAGEWGHASIDPQGPKCWCGAHGCIETFISGGGLERLYEKKYGKKKTLTDVVTSFRQKEEPAVQFMQTFFANFGRAMANLINILDPDIVVLGGGLSNIDELYTEGVEEVQKRIFSDDFQTPIVKNQLGDSAGVIGAALISR